MRGPRGVARPPAHHQPHARARAVERRPRERRRALVVVRERVDEVRPDDPLLRDHRAQVGVRQEGRLLRARARVRLPHRQLGPRVVAIGTRRAIERDRLQLRAAAGFDLQGQIVALIPGDVDRRARHVRAAEEVGLVLARVVAARRAVAIREPADRRGQVQVLIAAQLRPQQLEECLVDAQVRLQTAVARIGQVVRRDLDLRLDPIVAVLEVELGPRPDQAVRVAPVDVVRVRHQRRRAQLRPRIAAVRILRRRRAPRHAHRRAEVAGHLELPLRARLRGDDRRGLGGRREAPADLRV